MSEKLLNSGCIFQCSLCPTVKIKPTEVNTHRTYLGGKKVLTTTTQMQVMVPGNCPKLPQDPTGINCLMGEWLTGSWKKYSKHTANGKNILLESSEFVCVLGGGTITAVPDNFGRVVQESYSLPTLTTITDLNKVSDDKISNRNGNNDNTGKAPMEDSAADKENKNSDSKKEDKTTDSEEFQEIEDLYCPYDGSKEKCRDCRYLQTNSSYMESAQPDGTSITPATILRRNYERDYEILSATRKCYKHPCKTIDEEYALFDQAGCGNAAHHIISTKDVYEQDKLKFVVKLANFYRYDVNESYNCILLPGINAAEERSKTEFHVKFGKATEQEKRRIKNEFMRATGRQWHGGGHGMDFENTHNISCYAHEVTDLVYFYMKRETRQHCRIDERYYNADRERFTKIIHQIIDLVRDKLISFEVNPMGSLPFYVSADAYYYASQTKSNISFLFFRKKGEQIEVYRYALIRNKHKAFVDEKARKIFEPSQELSMRRMALFCKKIDIAYVDVGYGRVEIPFAIQNIIEVNMKGIDVSDYMKKNISAVESELNEIEEQR